MATQRQITAQGDSLLILAYRCWQSGFDYSDAECWQYAWVVLSNAFGPEKARPVLSAMEDFVRGVRRVGTRRLEYFPPPCCRASESEQAVLDLVAGLQRGEPKLDRWVEALCGPLSAAAAEEVLTPARALASSLLEAGAAIVADASDAAARPPGKHLH